MDIHDLLDNAALLLALSISQSFIQHHWIRNSTWEKVVRGLLYGGIAIGCMLTPVNFSEGIIFDGRSVTLCIGGLFGGPIVGVIAGVLAAAYRIYLGGTGMLTGVGGIIITTVAGLTYRSLIKGKVQDLNFLKLLIFGFISHVIMMLWFITLPYDVFLLVIQTITVPYISLYSLMTAIVGSVIVDQEKRILAEENSRVNEQKYRTLIETAPDFILTIDRQGFIQFINQIPPFFNEEEVISASIYKFPEVSYRKKIKKIIDQVFLTHKKNYYDFSVIRPDGTKVWYTTSIAYLEDNEKKELAIIIAKDITQQKNDFDVIQKRNQEIRILYEINQSIRNSLDLEEIYDAFSEGINKIIPCNGVTIYSYSIEDKKLQYEYSRWECKKKKAKKNPEVPLSENELEQIIKVIQTGTPLPITEAFNPPRDFMDPQKKGSGFLIPIIYESVVVGIIEIFNIIPDSNADTELHIFQAIVAQIAIASNNAKLYRELQLSNKDIQLAYDKTLEGWGKALQMREKETADHTHRVAELTMKLADAMGIPEEKKVHIWRGALLHDVGKLVIPDKILLKPGPLDDKEWEIMRKHPVYAYEWLNPIEYLLPALDIPYCHHEWWDGSGYPRGIAGDEIPLAARMFAVVDVYDALTSNRPYRKAWSHKKTIQYIKQQSGTHFDPNIVEVFMKLFSN